MTEDEKEFEIEYQKVMEKLDLHYSLKYYSDPDLLMKNAMRLIWTVRRNRRKN